MMNVFSSFSQKEFEGYLFCHKNHRPMCLCCKKYELSRYDYIEFIRSYVVGCYFFYIEDPIKWVYGDDTSLFFVFTKFIVEVNDINAHFVCWTHLSDKDQEWLPFPFYRLCGKVSPCASFFQIKHPNLEVITLHQMVKVKHLDGLFSQITHFESQVKQLESKVRYLTNSSNKDPDDSDELLSETN